MSKLRPTRHRDGIVFLDFDGVLNRESDDHEFALPPIQKRKIDRLNDICRMGRANIVITSSWRKLGLNALQHLLKTAGVKARVVDIIHRHQLTRGNEISTWLHAHPHVKRFVILDDRDDMNGVFDHLVQTKTEIGLKSNHIGKAIKILNRHGRYAEASS